MKTNELEKEIGLSKYTIRYYEKEGLIQPKREENGYRDYDDETVQKLKIIKFLRNLQIPSLPKYLANFPYFTGFPAHSLVK